MKAFKWIIPILVFVLLIACNLQTLVPQETSPVESQATDIPVSEPTPTKQPEIEPTVPPTTVPEIESTEETLEISQPNAGWSAVSEQGNWVLVGYGDALNPTVVEPGTYLTIKFSSSDDQVTGSGGCNNYFTSYTADGSGNLTINSPIGSTMMACETGMQQESMFLGSLEAVTGYTMTVSGKLLLDYDSDAVYDEQLVFIPETAMIDTVWVMVAYGDPNDLTQSKPGVFTTVIFSADGTLSGSTGCNNYVAQYNLNEGNQITISFPAINLAACGIGMEQEQAYLTLLEASQSYRLGMNSLEITAADGSLIRFSAQHLPLENVLWSLVAIDGQAVPESITANALFLPAGSPDGQSDENMVNGSAGCNNYFGPYSAAEGTLTAGPFGLTRKICNESALRVEQAFLAGLETAQTYQIKLDQLVIQTNTGSLVFSTERLPLEGPQWILTGSGPVDNPQPPVEGSIFSASFSRQFGMPSGTKNGETSCREYSATYTAGFEQMKVNLPTTSRSTCTDVQLETEQAYFLGLNTAHDYHIMGKELYVYYDDFVLIFVGDYPAADVGPLVSLNNTQWTLTSSDSNVVLPGSVITILFEVNSDGRTGSVSGLGGCNTYNAELTGVFTLGPIIVSAASCDSPQGVMEQERAYLTALQNAKSVWVEGNRLIITTDQGALYYTSGVTIAERPSPAATPEALTAVIVAPGNAHVDQEITYDGSSSTPKGGITSFSWWFTGDETAEGMSVKRTYDKTGAYDAILTVTNARGQTSTASVKTKVHSYLVGPVWVLEEGEITLKFDENTLSGNTGCNDYSASYSASEDPGKSNKLSISSISKTKKKCAENIMEKEKAFLENLREATSYRININSLTISPNDVIMTFYTSP